MRRKVGGSAITYWNECLCEDTKISLFLVYAMDLGFESSTLGVFFWQFGFGRRKGLEERNIWKVFEVSWMSDDDGG